MRLRRMGTDPNVYLWVGLGRLLVRVDRRGERALESFLNANNPKQVKFIYYTPNLTDCIVGTFYIALCHSQLALRSTANWWTTRQTYLVWALKPDVS